MQPCPPCALKPSAVMSSPESWLKSSPIAMRCCDTRAMLAVASFTPAMFGKLIQPLHRVDVDVDDRAGRNVVHDDRNADGVVDRLEVLVEPFLGRLVVIGRHHQHGVGAGLLGVLRQADRLGGRVRARARDHRNPALGLVHAPFDDLLVLLVGERRAFARWCRPERGRWCPRRSASPPGRGTPFRPPSRS